jgi:hypothetical protein
MTQQEADLDRYEDDVRFWDRLRLAEELARLETTERNWKEVMDKWGIGAGQFLLAGAKLALVRSRLRKTRKPRHLAKGICHV